MTMGSLGCSYNLVTTSFDSLPQHPFLPHLRIRPNILRNREKPLEAINKTLFPTHGRAKNAVRYHLRPVVETPRPGITAHLMLPPMWFFLMPQLTNSLFCLYKNSMKTASVLEHCIWEDLNIRSWATVTHVWLRHELSFIAFEVKLGFFFLHQQ